MVMVGGLVVASIWDDHPSQHVRLAVVGNVEGMVVVSDCLKWG